MAEPIDPHGAEADKKRDTKLSAEESDLSSTADPRIPTRTADQPHDEPDTSSTNTISTTTDAPSASGGEIVPASEQTPADAPDSELNPAPAPSPDPKVKQPMPAESLAKTRAAAAWLATGAALIILGLIIILILQNQETVEVNYLWFSGSLPLGAALLIAAVAGAAMVMIVGTVRLTQVRRNTRRAQKVADLQRNPSA